MSEYHYIYIHAGVVFGGGGAMREPRRELDFEI